MRKAEVYRNGILAGYLIEEEAQKYIFTYDKNYFNNPKMPAISLTLPKTHIRYENEFLFPFFFNMLSEGVNRRLQSRQLKIDEADHFGLLLVTAQYDTIGAISIKKIMA